MSFRQPGQEDIVVDYYQGAYGPTIRIDIQTLENLLKVREIFARMANATDETRNFFELGDVTVSGLSALILRSTVKEKEGEKKLQAMEGGQEGPAFLWTMTPNGWSRSAGLIDGIIESVSPGGHQYLTQEGIDDALVEVSFME